MPNQTPGILREDEDFLGNEIDQNGQKSSRRKVVILVIIILLLLLLFWPVSPEEVRKQRLRAKREEAAALAQRPAGAAQYTIISGGPMVRAGSRIIRVKAIPVGVRFEVLNLSTRDEILDYSMVKLRDNFGKEYLANQPLIEEWYEVKGRSSPWGNSVGARRKIKALAIFYVFRGPKKTYSFEGRDFEWVSNRTSELPVGTFDTFGR